jgi:amino acid transporter
VATAVVAGTVIGSGIFKKPATVAGELPFFGMAALVWVLGGLLALVGALAYAEVVTLYPRAGGNYVLLREGYGRLFGFLWGWVEFFIIRSASIAALATIFTNSLHAMCRELLHSEGELLGYWPQRLLTVGVILGLALVNVRGVRWGGVLQLFITAVKVGSLLALICLPFVLAAIGNASAARPRVENLTPTWPSGDQIGWGLLSGCGSSLLAVLWAYHGWMNIAPVAEEVRNPQRNLPLSLLAGVGIVIALYLLTNLSYALVLPQDEMKTMKASSVPLQPGEVHDDTVAIGYCRRLLGPAGVAFAAAAVMISVFGALNGNLLVGPRLLYAMGQDKLAPRALAEVHPRFRTPAWAILVMAGWACCLILGVAIITEWKPDFAKKDHFDILTDFAMFGAVIFETMAVLSIFIFRHIRPDAERTYRCPGYPVLPALYIVLPALILTNMFSQQPLEAGVGVGFILLGTFVYYTLGLQNTSGETSR